jgi:hypothetical protein
MIILKISAFRWWVLKILEGPGITGFLEDRRTPESEASGRHSCREPCCDDSTLRRTPFLEIAACHDALTARQFRPSAGSPGTAPLADELLYRFHGVRRRRRCLGPSRACPLVELESLSWSGRIKQDTTLPGGDFFERWAPPKYRTAPSWCPLAKDLFLSWYMITSRPRGIIRSHKASISES